MPPREKPRVFLSHSTEDRAIAIRIVEALRMTGAEVWIHYEHRGNIAREVEKGLNWSNWFCVVLSKKAVDSKWVQDEAYTALDMLRAEEIYGFLPVLGASVDLREIPRLWRIHHQYDLLANFDEELRLLCEHIWADTLEDYDEMGPEPGAEPPQIYTKLNPKARASGVEMIHIPGGDFQMGDEEWPDTRPVRTVTLSRYSISKTPVTVAQFRVFTDDSGYNYDWEKNKQDWGWNAHPDYPMVNVSWDDAMAFCNWAGGTLPTEAQWERAAKGPKGTKYPWGDEWNNNLCVNSDNSNKQPAPVLRPDRMYQTSEGLLDMAGNVWQWCRDWYAENYELLKLQAPENTIKKQYRVLRGGSWVYGDPENVRSASRFYDDPGNRVSDTGFRLAGL